MHFAKHISNELFYTHTQAWTHRSNTVYLPRVSIFKCRYLKIIKMALRTGKHSGVEIPKRSWL